MELKTKCHGVIEYNNKDIIIFDKGIPGFEEYKKFIIAPLKDNELFNILHSIENEELGFISISPFQFMKDYEFELSDLLVEQLKIENPNDVAVYNLITLNSDIKKITANLKAPIVINVEKKLAHQVILSDERYPVKYPLFKED